MYELCELALRYNFKDNINNSGSKPVIYCFNYRVAIVN